MPRRRLRLSSSSDEEDQPPPQPQNYHYQNAQQQPPQSPTVTHSPVAVAPPNPYPSGSLPISSDDDEFIDVSDILSPPSPPRAPQPEPDNPPHPPPPAPAPELYNSPPPQRPSSGGCPISEHLQKLGLRLKREWLDACVDGLRQSVPGFQNLDVEAKAKQCFEQFLVSDMNRSGGGVLPENVASLHLVDLPGPYVLQVDENVNISNPLKLRYQKAPVGLKRCLKLSITDGVQRVFAMEYRPIPALEALAPAGGLVEELDAARQRLVDEVNKPPRGNRTRNGVVPPLVTRLALAAWPPSSVHTTGHTHSSTMEAPTPFQAPNQGTTVSVSARDTSSVSARDTSSVSSRVTSSVSSRNTSLVSSVIAEESTVPLSGELSAVNPSSTDVFGVEEMPMDTTPYSRTNAFPNPLSDDFGVENLHINTIHHSRESRVAENSIPDPLFEDALDVEDIEMDAVHSGGENHTSDSILNDEGETHGAYPSSDAILHDEDYNVLNEVELPGLLSGDQESPFIYLVSLETKLAVMKNTHSVQGKVKCVLTGVKKFHYTDTYELLVYVDDGTLIREILIDHKVVQKGIGHSSEEVRAALSSPDNTTIRNMKEKMKRFQKFLMNFEGIMLIEMRLHGLPIALEMKQGCTKSDAWLLLRRLKASPPARTSQHLFSHPIEISP